MSPFALMSTARSAISSSDNIRNSSATGCTFIAFPHDQFGICDRRLCPRGRGCPRQQAAYRAAPTIAARQEAVTVVAAAAVVAIETMPDLRTILIVALILGALVVLVLMLAGTPR